MKINISNNRWKFNHVKELPANWKYNYNKKDKRILEDVLRKVYQKRFIIIILSKDLKFS